MLQQASKHQCHLPTYPPCYICIYHVLIRYERYRCSSGIVAVARGTTSALEINSVTMWSHGGQQSFLDDTKLEIKEEKNEATIDCTLYIISWPLGPSLMPLSFFLPHASQLFPASRMPHTCCRLLVEMLGSASETPEGRYSGCV